MANELRGLASLGTLRNYLIGLYSAGPYSALFLRLALIRAGVDGAGVNWAVFPRKEKKSGVNFQNALNVIQ